MVAVIAFASPRPATGQDRSIASDRSANQKLLVIVLDENGVAVPSARVALTALETPSTVEGETDYAGRLEFPGLGAGRYAVRAEKEGFYAVVLEEVRAGETESLEMTLNHQQEFIERVDVIYSPPRIDPTETSSIETLHSPAIVNLPFSTTRDIRYALPLMTGVLQDATGQVHVEGAATYQTVNHLDGFNITHPMSGTFELRVSVDALRSIEVERSRYSAEHGKGSGGVLRLATGMGDDRFRFSATNFIPAVQSKKGLAIDNWTPRATFSGPLRKGRAWFLATADGEYGSTIFEELPEGADRNRVWRLSNLLKGQVNIRQAHILTGTFLLNRLASRHAGLSRFDPLETTRDLHEAGYFWSLKDQSYFQDGVLFEIGMAMYEASAEEVPQGTLPYVIRPEGTSGNYFRRARGRARRTQWIANALLPPARWAGRHEFKLGTDVDWITYHQLAERRPISILNASSALVRQVSFELVPEFSRNNFELSGFAQDRWSVSDRLHVELGLRLDWDQVVRRVAVSPRFAASCLLTGDGNTKLVFGVGLFRDATNLELITQPLSGRRWDFVFGPNESLQGPPVESALRVEERRLRPPRILNWSVALERKLPRAVDMRVEFLHKRGANGLAYFSPAQPGPSGGLFELRSDRRDRYHTLQVALRRVFKGNYMWSASYARSSARSNAALDISLDDPTDNPLFSRQAGGPLLWDAPNRLLSWGWFPLIKKFDLAYTLDWRDGFPFSLVNQDQQLVGAPNTRRFPDYFSLNLHVERRFRFLGFQWALRAGFDNITGRTNPSAVNNNVDSPLFLTYGGRQGRAFTGRIRFLGRK